MFSSAWKTLLFVSHYSLHFVFFCLHSGKRGRLNNLKFGSKLTRSPNNCCDIRNRTSTETRESKRRRSQRNQRGKKYDINLHENKLHDERDSYQHSLKEDQGESYRRRLTGDGSFPISTLIKLPKIEHRIAHNAENYRHKSNYPLYDDCRSSSNTSGFGTIEHRGKHGSNKNSNYCNNNPNNNNNNNTDSANVFVWREPTNTNGQARAISPKVPAAHEAQDNNRAINDVVVWFPSGQNDDNSVGLLHGTI